MAEEEVVVGTAAAAASPPQPDHKRKLDDLEPEALEPAEQDGEQGADVVDSLENDESEAKRPRVGDQDEDLGTENGYERETEDEDVKENVEELTVENVSSEEAPHPTEGAPEAPHPTEGAPEAPHPTEGAPEALDGEQPSDDNEQKDDTRQPSIEHPLLETTQQPTGEEFEKPVEEFPQQEVGDFPSTELHQQTTSDSQTMSRKMEVPNNKVGVLIGKAGDTIRFLQYNSGAKIQITRDADSDPYSASRSVELIGSLENINKAEKLIRDVIAEADAGGSPSLVARGFATAQAVGAAEQVQIQVPNEKVGLIIGKGGETIKSLQTRSGARIQLIPQHLPEGDQSKERTVRVTGDKKQIEMAREMIKEVMNQPVRSSTYPSNYNSQGYRPRGPPGPSQWGPRAPHSGPPTGYDYQRGPYPSQNQQYPPYGSYPPQQMAPRSSFGSGWEQRPPTNMQGPPQSGGYDFYGGQGGHGPDAPVAAPHSASMSIHAPGPNPSHGMGPPSSQGNYNYGQPQGSDYGQQAQYSQSGPAQQGYGHGYDEPKYEGQAPTHPPYGHGSQTAYPQGGVIQSGYPQQPYGKSQPYGMASQAPAAAQSYGLPRATQPGDVPYPGPMPSNPSYGPNVPPQQYPYPSSGPMQQTYPAYGSQPAADGYSQPPPASGAGYMPQGAQAMSGYSQPGGQQAPNYAQTGHQGGYGAYPAQPGYADQQTTNNAVYGYQGPADPAYSSGAPASAYGAQPSGQSGYVQPAPAQQSYDQSIPAQSGGYGAVQATAPVSYGKSLSPQPGYPQYDATQMYGAHR